MKIITLTLASARIRISYTIQIESPQAKQLVVKARADNRLYRAIARLKITPVVHALVFFESGHHVKGPDIVSALA